ncbi:hypothetical protein BLA29_011230, partial [Euroglyphus maynei]
RLKYCVPWQQAFCNDLISPIGPPAPIPPGEPPMLPSLPVFRPPPIRPIICGRNGCGGQPPNGFFQPPQQQQQQPQFPNMPQLSQFPHFPRPPYIQSMPNGLPSMGGMPNGLPPMSGMPNGLPTMSGMPNGFPPTMSGMPNGLPPSMSGIPNGLPSMPTISGIPMLSNGIMKDQQSMIMMGDMNKDQQ